MSAPALFPEPERVEVPTTDGPWKIAAAGWRYTLLGEDGEYLVIQGHVPDSGVVEVLREAGMGPDCSIYIWDLTWARELTACPDHSAKTEGCLWCQGITPGEPWWDWSTPPDEPEVHRNKAGYFPVTVIDVEV